MDKILSEGIIFRVHPMEYMKYDKPREYQEAKRVENTGDKKLDFHELFNEQIRRLN